MANDKQEVSKEESMNINGQVDSSAEEANRIEYESLRDKLAKVANVRGEYIRAKLSGAVKENRS